MQQLLQERQELIQKKQNANDHIIIEEANPEMVKDG
jgi:hypothetical protein